MFTWILYYLFRTIARVYLYFTNNAGKWKRLEKTWEKNNIVFSKFRIQNEGHERHFVFVDTFSLDNESLDWHQIIHFSDSILACTINGIHESDGQIDITDTVKEFSHYIYSNPFLTFNDLFTLFDIETKGPFYNIKIVFSDLSERECFVKDTDLLKMTFTLQNDNDNFQLENIPFM